MEATINTSRPDDMRVAIKPVSFPKKASDKCCHVITINKSPAVVYAFCEDQSNLETFIKDRELDFKWDVLFVKDEAQRTIHWFSTENSEIKTIGHVWIDEAPQKLGSVVTLVMEYSMTGGKIDDFFAKSKGEDIESLILTNLKRIKCFLETGEVATIEGQTSGREENLEFNTLPEGDTYEGTMLGR